jgi:hypothetical protein
MPQTPWESIGQEMERHQSELIGLREVIDRLAVSENNFGGVLGGLSYWLQRIIDDVEDTKDKVPIAAVVAPLKTV